MKAIIIYGLLFVAAWMTLTTINIPEPEELEDKSQELFALINQERERLHIRPLVWNERLAQLATEHSQCMAETDDYQHSDYSLSEGLAENIMVGMNPHEVYEAWCNSSLHYSNITNPRLIYGAIGMGMKLTNLTIGSANITISTSRAYTTFMAK